MVDEWDEDRRGFLKCMAGAGTGALFAFDATKEKDATASYSGIAIASSNRSFVKDGFGVSEWSHRGLRYAAVSDIATQELTQFHRLFLARSG